MISVLTVNYHSADDVMLLVESVRAHPVQQPVELIVTNNSPEEPVRLPNDPVLPVTIIESQNRGYAAGVNLAFRRSAGDIIMIANPDLRVGDGTLDAAAAYLDANPDVGIALPLLRYPTGDIQHSVRTFYTWPAILHARSPLRMLKRQPAFFRRYLCLDIDRTTPSPVDWGLGAAMFLRRTDGNADGNADGIFDERFFMYFEDVDLCYRMWQHGRAVMYCPHIECTHAHRRLSRNPLSKSGWRHFTSLARFIRKHGGLPRRPPPIVHRHSTGIT